MNLTSLVAVFLLLAVTKPPLVPTRAPEPRPPAQGWEPASPTEVAEFCKTNKCRVPGPFHLKLADGSYFELTTKKVVPIVSGGLISVFPGETVYVEARLVDDRLVDLVAVDRLVHPEQTLVFTLSQQQTIGDGTGMRLKIANTFPVTLKYRLGFMHPESTRLRKTSSCPLKAGSTQYEAWPHPIFQIVAASFRVVPPNSEEAKTCD